MQNQKPSIAKVLFKVSDTVKTQHTHKALLNKKSLLNQPPFAWRQLLSRR